MVIRPSVLWLLSIPTEDNILQLHDTETLSWSPHWCSCSQEHRTVLTADTETQRDCHDGTRTWPWSLTSTWSCPSSSSCCWCWSPPLWPSPWSVWTRCGHSNWTLQGVVKWTGLTILAQSLAVGQLGLTSSVACWHWHCQAGTVMIATCLMLIYWVLHTWVSDH